MYQLGKRVISQYIRTGCRRRLRLDLYLHESDRQAHDVPQKDTSRPGLALLTEQGKDYEQEKYLELIATFPGRVRHGPEKERNNQTAFAKTFLANLIHDLPADTFAIEAQYDVAEGGVFCQAHHLADLEDGSAIPGGGRLTFDALRPDILQIRPAGDVERRVVTPSGLLKDLPSTDQRLGIRIIDIKIAGEPSPSHFAELAYYGMTLAAWLIDNGFDDRYVVLAEAAIWPGNHEGSAIWKLDREDHRNHIVERDFHRYLPALESDLETMPPEVVIGRIQRFLTIDLREVLAPAQWRTLEWHITSRCSGCDYLGYRWSRHDNEETELAVSTAAPSDARYCWPTAEATGHLSRIAGLTEGAAGKLRSVSVPNVADVGRLSAGHSAFESHQALRAKRTVLRDRAQILEHPAPAMIPDRAGTSACLPRFSDIQVAVSVDFDVGSGLTFALGYSIRSGIPEARNTESEGSRYSRKLKLGHVAMLVPERTLESEGDNLTAWLTHMVRDIQRARVEVLAGYQSHGGSQRDVSIQFYLWDRLTFEHLCRVMGRHLDRLHSPVTMGDLDVSLMSWIFPAESVLEEPDFLGRASPITIVSDAINGLMAAPIPHHYGVIDLANHLDAASRVLPDGKPWWFHVNKFYRDPLSDQIPSERGHEIWNKASPFADRDYQWHQDNTREVVRRKLRATMWVATKLTSMLGEDLKAEAPQVGSVFRRIARVDKVGDDGQILFQHARLMAAAHKLEVELLMAMPPHEREARFDSARVERVLEGPEREKALDALGLRPDAPRLLVFKLAERSREARLKSDDFLWSFMPESDLANVQHCTVAQFKRTSAALEALLPTKDYEYRKLLRDAMRVTIVRLDRGRELLVVEPHDLLEACIDLGLLDMNLDGSRKRFGIVDPVSEDFFTWKLRVALQQIAHPPLARDRPLFPSLGVTRVRKAKPTNASNSPAAEMIWNADVLASTPMAVDATPFIQTANEVIGGLTTAQCSAIRQSVERRLALWWGPPGTGKSRTAQAYLMALAERAHLERRPLSIAIMGFTWVAIDNVARKLPELLRRRGLQDGVNLARLLSTNNLGKVDLRLHDYAVSMADDSPQRNALDQSLLARQGIHIVATTVDQIAKLKGTFDHILIDEASQLDVAHAIVGLTKLAPDGHVTVVGDDKQMKPIHPLEPPEGLEHLLGSIYSFYRGYRCLEGPQYAIAPIMLDTSFRSSQAIIDFVREAGYGSSFKAHENNAGHRIAVAAPFPNSRPVDWPDHLPWSAHFAEVLDLQAPLGAVVHPDRFSSQRNDAEADLVAGLVLALFRVGLMDLEAQNQRPLATEFFFPRGVGIVTPHRAQQAAVFDRLDRYMPADVDRNEMFASIDTVERFQGQEKVLMIASFGLGDADQIASEEEFLFSLNRFNVAASRAQAKFVAIVSRQLVDHLPRDRTALEESRLLKHYVDGFLTAAREIQVEGLGACQLKTR